jgi:class 3 adenylate cyclase
MGEAPTGTVTFLFTDIEGSTQLWQTASDAMPACLARHDELLRAAFQRPGRTALFDAVGGCHP